MSTYLDFDKYDGSIHLSSDSRRGIWATQLLTRARRRPVRNAGHLPTTASSHSLLTVGLMTALRDITKARAADLVKSANAGLSKPRIVVTSLNLSYCDGLQAKIQGQHGTPLRAGRNFLVELARQLVRFDITWVTDQENKICHSLKNWADRAIPDPKWVATIPAALMPCAVSVVL